MTITADEPLDAGDNGEFAKIENLAGDSSQEVRPESTKDKVLIYLNGDGATGAKKCQVQCDGHLGEGKQALTLDIEYTVGTPDATLLVGTEEGADEPMPGNEPAPATSGRRAPYGSR